MELVTPDLGTIFWMTIVFAVVVVILKKFAWKPILSGLYEREESIAHALDLAEKARKEMEKLKAGNEELLTKAKKERELILEQAIVVKENIIAEAKEKAAAETQKNIEQARRQIQNEKQAAIEDVKKQVAEVSLMIAEKIIRKEMADDKLQQKMVNDLIEEVKLN